jgi:hypothetical protein
MATTSNLDLFPARISDRTVTATEAPKGIPIAGGFNPANDTVIIPVADTAFARTVRLHESAHAIWSRDGAKPDAVSQACEDAKIHMKLHTTGSTRRDELYTAASEARNVAKAIRQGRKDRALQGLALLRAASILLKPDSSEPGIKTLITTTTAYHSQGMELVSSILAEIKAGNMDAAKRLTSVFFAGKDADKTPDPEGEEASDSDERSEGEPGDTDSDEGEPGDTDSDEGEPGDTDSDEGEPAKDSDQPSSKPEDRPTLSAPTMVEIPREFMDGKPDDYTPEPAKKAERAKHAELARRDPEDGTVTVIDCLPEDKPMGLAIPYPKMYVHTLTPNATRKVKGKGRNAYRSTDVGLKIRMNRLALNAASPTGGARIFETRHLGGTVLIDASGSMRLGDRELYRLAEKFPAGKVAYYSGRVDGWCGPFSTPEELECGWSGDLVIYAANGKIRKDHGACLPKRHVGNLVDYAAIIWLLRQPAPRYMLFDKIFTGTSALIKKAKTLLEKAEAQKRITVYRHMETMMDEVRKLR